MESRRGHHPCLCRDSAVLVWGLKGCEWYLVVPGVSAKRRRSWSFFFFLVFGKALLGVGTGKKIGHLSLLYSFLPCFTLFWAFHLFFSSFICFSSLHSCLLSFFIYSLDFQGSSGGNGYRYHFTNPSFQRPLFFWMLFLGHSMFFICIARTRCTNSIVEVGCQGSWGWGTWKQRD